MRRNIPIVLLLLFGLCLAANAWDVGYVAAKGLLPSECADPWEFSNYGATVSLLDGTLHIGDSGGAGYCREAASIAAGVPVSIETRFWVASTQRNAAELCVSTYGRELHLYLSADHIVTIDREYDRHTFWLDFTTPHTLRLAFDGLSQARAWVDGDLAMTFEPRSWSPTDGPPGGIRFGSGYCHSYWEYVAYSKEFLPLPEPSSLLALLAGLGGLGGVMWRRRR